MIDWWDADHDITGVNGAERDYYLSLDEPYECRDGDLPVIEELLLVKGVTEQIYYGDAGNPEQATTMTPADLEELIKTGGRVPEAAPEAEPEEQARGSVRGKTQPWAGQYFFDFLIFNQF